MTRQTSSTTTGSTRLQTKLVDYVLVNRKKYQSKKRYLSLPSPIITRLNFIDSGILVLRLGCWNTSHPHSSINFCLAIILQKNIFLHFWKRLFYFMLFSGVKAVSFTWKIYKILIIFSNYAHEKVEKRNFFRICQQILRRMVTVQ